MSDELTRGQKILIRVGTIVGILILAFGALLIVDEYQQLKRDKATTAPVDITEPSYQIPAFDVDGLTDEEIEELLEMYRKRYGEETKNE